MREPDDDGLDRRRIEAGVEPARTSRGERYAMNETSIIVARQPDEIGDPLTSIVRAGARHVNRRSNWALTDFWCSSFH